VNHGFGVFSSGFSESPHASLPTQLIPKSFARASALCYFSVPLSRTGHDPEGREFVEQMQRQAASFGLDDGALYYDFPTYSDYETVAHKPEIWAAAGLTTSKERDRSAKRSEESLLRLREDMQYVRERSYERIEQSRALLRRALHRL
jgi:hypothetical protein